MIYTSDSSGYVTTPPHVRQVADRMGSISQRAMLCHRGHHEPKAVLRHTRLNLVHQVHPTNYSRIDDLIPIRNRWLFIGNKCKHCGRWV